MTSRRTSSFLGTCLSALLITALALALPSVAGAAETGGIAGTVTLEGAGPAHETEVCAYSPNFEEEDCAATEADGSYEMVGLAPGQYVVQFWPYGQNYVWSFYSGTQEWDSAQRVTVASGAVTSGIDGELEVGAKITGTVTAAATTRPVGEVEVCAESAAGRSGGRCAWSDERGEYTIQGLPGGEWSVYFYASPEAGVNLVDQAYDGRSLNEAPDPVSVAAKGEVDGIDAALKPGATISGTVTSAATGLPVDDVDVCATETTGNGSRCRLTDPAGTYALEGLEAGDWSVYFRPEELPPSLLAQPYPGQVALVEAQHVQGIDAVLALGGTITGTVRSAEFGDQAMPGVKVCLAGALDSEARECTTTDNSGAYRFSGLSTGMYTVAFSPALRDVYEAEFAEFLEENETSGQLAPWNDSLPTQWWDQQSSFAAATRIPVTAPQTVGGVDAVFGTAPAPPAAKAASETPKTLVAKAKPKPKKKQPLKCRRGFVKRKVHGEVRCTKKRRAVPRRRQHRKHAA